MWDHLTACVKWDVSCEIISQLVSSEMFHVRLSHSLCQVRCVMWDYFATCQVRCILWGYFRACIKWVVSCEIISQLVSSEMCHVRLSHSLCQVRYVMWDYFATCQVRCILWGYFRACIKWGVSCEVISQLVSSEMCHVRSSHSLCQVRCVTWDHLTACVKWDVSREIISQLVSSGLSPGGIVLLLT